MLVKELFFKWEGIPFFHIAQNAFGVTAERLRVESLQLDNCIGRFCDWTVWWDFLLLVFLGLGL